MACVGIDISILLSVTNCMGLCYLSSARPKGYATPSKQTDKGGRKCFTVEPDIENLDLTRALRYFGWRWRHHRPLSPLDTETV